MANRRLVYSSNHENVVPVGGNIQHKTRNKTKTVFQSQIHLVTLTIVACLLSNNCLTYARLTSSDKSTRQKWLEADDQFRQSILPDQPVEQGVESFVSPGRLSGQQSVELNEFLSRDDQPIILNDQSPAYYMASEGAQLEAHNVNYIPSGYNEYMLAGRLTGDQNDAADEQDRLQLQLASRGDDLYYPVGNSFRTDNNPDLDLNDDQQALEIKSKLADLIEFEDKLSQQSPNRYNLNNIDSFDNIKIANLQVYPATLVGANQDEQQVSRIESSSLPGETRNGLGREEKAFTLLEDDSQILAATNDDDNKHDRSTTSTTPKPSSSTVSYGAVVTASSSSTSQTPAPSSMFNNMYQKLSGFLPFLSQINLLRQSQSAGNNQTTNLKSVQDEKVAFAKQTEEKELSSSTKPSVSKTDRAPTEGFSRTGKNPEAGEEEVSRSIKVNLLRQSSESLPAKPPKDELVGSASEPAQSLLGRYIYGPEHSLTTSSVTDDTSKSAPVKKLGNEYRTSKVSHRYSSRRLQHPDDEDEEALDADDTEEDIISYAPARGYRPFYSHRRLVEEPLVGVRQQTKSNDLYFLIMVGSFCAMAIAVVLAAGLFAYRVQQNRKSTTETDYPTYGVVGPNNMTGGGKLGAASFVGGYFNSNIGAGNAVCPGNNALAAQLASGKLGAAKHLSDLYSVSDSGVLSTASGSCKSSSASIQRISSDQQQQQEMQRREQSNCQMNHQASIGKQSNASSAGSAYAANCQDAARMYHYQHQKQQMIISDRNSGRHNSASDLDSEEENDDGSYTVYECPGLASAHEMEIKNPLFNDDQTP